MPIKSRARSARSVDRDAQILDAALVEVATSGLDGLGMHAVARRAGFTAGTVYSRHETVGELAVAVWLERGERALIGLLAESLTVALDGGDPSRLVDEILERRADVLVGLEIVAVARRHSELGEVVNPSVSALLRWNELNSVERSAVAFVVGLTFGALLHGGPTAPDRTAWTAILGLVRYALDQPVPTLPPWMPRPGKPVRSTTNDPLRDSLIDGACEVIGRVGFVSATNTRIARRAGLTSGAVYTMYRSKDELLVDAIDMLLGGAIDDNDMLTDGLSDGQRMSDAAAHLLNRGGGDDRRPWLRFRLETYVSARYRPDFATLLDRLHREGQSRYETMLAPAGVVPAVAHLVGLVGQAIPLGLAVLDAFVSDVERIDFRPVTVPLLGAVAELGRRS